MPYILALEIISKPVHTMNNQNTEPKTKPNMNTKNKKKMPEIARHLCCVEFVVETENCRHCILLTEMILLRSFVGGFANSPLIITIRHISCERTLLELCIITGKTKHPPSQIRNEKQMLYTCIYIYLYSFHLFQREWYKKARGSNLGNWHAYDQNSVETFWYTQLK